MVGSPPHMATLIDTAAVEAQDRIAFWADSSRETFHPLHIRADRSALFRARMWGDSLASLRIFRVAATANTMHRTAQDISVGDDESIHLSIMLRGELRCEQDDRASRLGPGDMTSYDTSHPALMHANGDFDMWVLKVPRALLGRDLHHKLARSTAMRIPSDAGLPRLAMRFFCGSAAGLADGSIVPEDADLAEHVIDLIRRLYTDLDSPPAIHSRSRTDLLLQAKAYIQAHLGDPELGPEPVARACFVSTRYLHRVFACDGRTVAEFIRSERLKHCRRDLANPALSHQSIATIATRWGLTSAPHFSRLFRAAYTCSPREFRHRALIGAL